MRAEELTPERRAAAEELLRDPALLWRVGQAMRQQGVVGEKRSGLTIYIVCISCFIEDPMALTAKGNSAIGKSWVTEKAVALIPEENVHVVSRLTKNALYYFDNPDALVHKVLVIIERGGEEDAASSVRLLISEHSLSVDVTAKDAKTQEPKTIHKEVKGPTAVVTTTTKAKLAVDDETRNLSTFMDDSEDQTKAIVKAQAARYGAEPPEKPNLLPFVDALRILRDSFGKSFGVFIPYADFLAEKFPTKDLRARRDFNKLLRSIAIIAVLHLKQRQHDAKGRVIALPEDFGYAWALIGDSLRRTLFNLPPKTEKLLQAAKTVVEEKRARNLTPFSFNRSDLATELGWTSDEVANWIEPLQGTYFDVLEGGQGKTYKYRLSAAGLGTALDLPSVEEIRQAVPYPPVEAGTTEVPTGIGDDFVTSVGGDGEQINEDNGSTNVHTCYFDPTADGFPECPGCGQVAGP